MNKRPDYSFADGVTVVKRNFSTPGIEEQQYNISRNELRQASLVGDNLKREVDEKMNNPVIIHGLGRTAISVAVIGSDNAENIMIYFMGWGE